MSLSLSQFLSSTAPAPTASVPRRVAAFGLDYLLILVYLGCLLALAVVIAPQITHWFDTLVAARLASLLFVTVPVSLYFILGEASAAQATLGKRWLGIRVQMWDGRRLSLSSSVIRTALKFAPWEFSRASIWRFAFAAGDAAQIRLATIYLGVTWSLVVFYLMCIAVDKRRRAPYDFAARSVVLRDSMPAL